MRIPTALWILLLALPMAARAENCSAEERADADRRLWLDAASKAFAETTHAPWGLPVATVGAPRLTPLTQRNYLIGYSGQLRVPVWTANQVTAGDGVRRRDCFRADPRLRGVEASRPSDYREPLFDQGHMVPSADAIDSVGMLNTFVMSNMAPQFCQFNRGVWMMLEALVRDYAQSSPVFVVTGAVFDYDRDAAPDAPDTVVRMARGDRERRVAVPSAFFKVLARKTAEGTVETVSILLPHNQSEVRAHELRGALQRGVVTLAAVERVSGLDLFPTVGAGHRDATTLWPSELRPRSFVDSRCRRTSGAVVERGTGLPYYRR